MDYFQGVVTEYLRAKRSVFVNTEYLIQLDDCELPGKDRHWYCDAVAIDHQQRMVDLCEITYSTTLHSVCRRLESWRKHWALVVAAIHRDSCLDETWRVQPHLFVPEHGKSILDRKLPSICGDPTTTEGEMPFPQVTFLESITPWKYRSWNRKPYAQPAIEP